MSNNFEMENHSHKHKLRFYIVVVTLFVGIIMFLFLMDSSNSGITGAITGTTENKGSMFSITESKNQLTNSGEINFKLSFDQLPQSEKEIKIENIKIKVQDLNSKILINDDEVELNNINEVSLELIGYVGEMKFGNALSINGVAKKIELNGVALSSPKDKLKISFNDLNYKNLELERINLPNIQFSEGNGQISVNDKLVYELKNEILEISSFSGNLFVEEGLVLEGQASEIKTNGDLNLVLN